MEQCIKELNMNKEIIQEIENATAPNGEYSCFFGCMSLKEGIVGSINLRFKILYS